MTKKEIYAQVPLFEKDLIWLKLKTGKSSTNDALAEAVKHFLECECAVTK